MVCSGFIWFYHSFGFSPCIHFGKKPIKTVQTRERYKLPALTVALFPHSNMVTGPAVWILHILYVSALVFSSLAM